MILLAALATASLHVSAQEGLGFAEANDFAEGVRACQGVTGDWAEWKQRAIQRGWAVTADRVAGSVRTIGLRLHEVSVVAYKSATASGTYCTVGASMRTPTEADAAVALVHRLIAANDQGRSSARLPNGERLSVFRGESRQSSTPVAANIYPDPR